MKNVKVFLFKVGEEPKVVEMGDDLHSLQKAVGGYIEAVYPFEDEYFIFDNEEGKLSGLEPNRNLGDYDVICGNFIVCKETEKAVSKTLTKPTSKESRMNSPCMIE